ncbi:cystatin-2-like [Anomaloglossus baeobatrachus]|uniref:cystatin-2-like n=1 Tax=Anomaloglossus baeobatrachus TaxID=238106 RepID=UPI003F50A884
MARLCVVVALLVCLCGVSQAGKLYGGREKADIASPEVKNALKFAMYELNKASNDMYEARVVNVDKAERKLVNGNMFYFDVTVGRTQCRKPTTDTSNCELHTDQSLAKTTTCHFEVYTVPWKAVTKLLEYKCNNPSN